MRSFHSGSAPSLASLPTMLALLEDADVVVGSRLAPGARVGQRQPLPRRIVGRSFVLLCRAVLSRAHHRPLLRVQALARPGGRGRVRGPTSTAGRSTRRRWPWPARWATGLRETGIVLDRPRGLAAEHGARAGAGRARAHRRPAPHPPRGAAPLRGAHRGARGGAPGAAPSTAARSRRGSAVAETAGAGRVRARHPARAVRAGLLRARRPAVRVWVKGGVVTGADGYLVVDPLQYLNWPRQAGEHGLVRNLYDIAPSPRAFLHPGVLLAGLAHRAGVGLVASYMLFKPVAIAALFAGALLYTRRFFSRRDDRRLALVLALFACSPIAALVGWGTWARSSASSSSTSSRGRPGPARISGATCSPRLPSGSCPWGCWPTKKGVGGGRRLGGAGGGGRALRRLAAALAGRDVRRAPHRRRGPALGPAARAPAVPARRRRARRRGRAARLLRAALAPGRRLEARRQRQRRRRVRRSRLAGDRVRRGPPRHPRRLRLPPRPTRVRALGAARLADRRAGGLRAAGRHLPVPRVPGPDPAVGRAGRARVAPAPAQPRAAVVAGPGGGVPAHRARDRLPRRQHPQGGRRRPPAALPHRRGARRADRAVARQAPRRRPHARVHGPARARVHRARDLGGRGLVVAGLQRAPAGHREPLRRAPEPGPGPRPGAALGRALPALRLPRARGHHAYRGGLHRSAAAVSAARPCGACDERSASVPALRLAASDRRPVDLRLPHRGVPACAQRSRLPLARPAERRRADLLRGLGLPALPPVRGAARAGPAGRRACAATRSAAPCASSRPTGSR